MSTPSGHEMDLKQVKIGKKFCYLFNRQMLIGDHFMLNVFGALWHNIYECVL
jgi:hypothetical protein